MNGQQTAELYYDPFDFGIDDDPYPVWKRMRAEAPLYYNSQHDFWALSRYTDVNRAIVDHGTFSSARGAIIELIKAAIPIPPGVLIFEDPPVHDIHRKLLARMFTPRKIALLEEKIRGYCAQSLDPIVGTGKFDFVTDLGAFMPMRTIGYLLGIPEEGQQQIRDRNDKSITVAAEQAGGDLSQTIIADSIAMFAEYIDWRATHPSDDLMTELLNAEIEDGDGTRRRLERTEVLAPAPGYITNLQLRRGDYAQAEADVIRFNNKAELAGLAARVSAFNGDGADFPPQRIRPLQRGAAPIEQRADLHYVRLVRFRQLHAGQGASRGGRFSRRCGNGGSGNRWSDDGYRGDR